MSRKGAAGAASTDTATPSVLPSAARWDPGRAVRGRAFGRRLELRGRPRPVETIANHARISLDRTDLVERLRRTMAEQTRQATHDHLTGLPNRRASRHGVDAKHWPRGGRSGEVAVVLIDLDRFKEVNDTLGHHMGDSCCARSGRLREPLGPRHDRPTRRRRFAVLLSRPTGPAPRPTPASPLRARASVAVGGLRIEVGASIGIAVAPETARRRTLIQRADVAMYVAKEPAGVAAYSPSATIQPRRLSACRRSCATALELE